MLHGTASGALTYLLALGIPSFFALWSMMFTNFVQHVACDPESKHNHSRNFVGEVGNWLLFSAGFHTVHHEHPGMHWSEYARLHRARSAAIAPSLNQSSLVGYCLSTYVLSRPPRRGRRVKAPAAGLESERSECAGV